ncbi:MAG: HAMP domain-containing sensor histidine kinase [Caldilineaceae bacterium]
MTQVNKRKLLGILSFVGMLLYLSLMFAVAFFVTSYLIRVTGWRLAAPWMQVLNSLLGLFIAFGVLGSVMRLFRSKLLRQQMNVIRPILEALDKIARGNFDVQVNHNFEGREVELFGELATGINSMAQQLKQMEAMRQEFISDISHEIQSPLTSIRGFAQALHHEQLSSEERSHYLQVIETESVRLSKLSDNLLALAALEADNRHFDPKTYRLDKQIRTIVLTCEPQWSNKRINLELALAELSLSADEDLLGQVWLNLLHNAIKFTPEEGQISLSLQKCAENVQFRINDTGIGIAAEDQPRLFERFFKADRARNRALGGSGLGLAIAKKIVEMHGGDISVESSLGAGATFIVQLPLGDHTEGKP